MADVGLFIQDLLTPTGIRTFKCNLIVELKPAEKLENLLRKYVIKSLLNHSTVDNLY